jgi:hypothetical protein
MAYNTKHLMAKVLLFALSMTAMFLLDLTNQSNTTRDLRTPPTALNLRNEREDTILQFKNSNNYTSTSTVVFGFFQLKISNHPSDKYFAWMKSAMCTTDAVVVFTSPDLMSHFQELRSHAMDRTLIVPMDVSEIQVGDHSHYDDVFWDEQRKYDIEGRKNGNAKNGQIYKIWHGKTWLVNQAIQINPFHSEKYVYMDIGLFRDEGILFCNKTVVRHPEVIPEDRVVLYPYRALKPYRDILRDKEPLWSAGFWSHYTSGGMISGGVEAWPKFMDRMEESVQLYVEKGIGVFDDQVMMQSTCMRNPGMCMVVRWDSPYGEGDGECYTGSQEALQQCIDSSGWRSGSMCEFFASKYRLWHGGDVKTMYWDPGLGTPSQEEDPGLYSNLQIKTPT